MLLLLAGNPKLTEGWQSAILDGLADGLGRAPYTAGSDPQMRNIIERLLQSASTPLVRASLRVASRLGIRNSAAQDRALAQAKVRALDESLSVQGRLPEIELLELGTYGQAGEALQALIDPRKPLEIQTAAARALAQFTDEQAGRVALANWRKYSPPVKAIILSMLLRRTSFHELLISSLEKRELTFGELNLDLEQRRRLLRHSTDSVRSRASALFGDHEFSNRKKVVDRYLSRLTPLSGKAARGENHFRSLCAKCHTLRGVGEPVGPDLAMAFSRGKEDLLTSILDPNTAIAPEYTNFLVETAKGELLSGIIRAETPTSITLVRANGESHTVLRSEIRQMRTDGLSLMPEGLEQGLSYQDIADLLAYLQLYDIR